MIHNVFCCAEMSHSCKQRHARYLLSDGRLEVYTYPVENLRHKVARHLRDMEMHQIGTRATQFETDIVHTKSHKHIMH